MKKLLISLGSVAAISAPVAKVIAVPPTFNKKQDIVNKIEEDAIKFSKKGRK